MTISSSAVPSSEDCQKSPMWNYTVSTAPYPTRRLSGAVRPVSSTVSVLAPSAPRREALIESRNLSGDRGAQCDLGRRRLLTHDELGGGCLVLLVSAGGLLVAACIAFGVPAAAGHEHGGRHRTQHEATSKSSGHSIPSRPRATTVSSVGLAACHDRLMTEIDAFAKALPKAELHLHIEGTLEPELKFDLAARNHVDLPYASVEEMRAAYDFDDLPSFLAQYYEGMSVLLTEDDFFDLAMAYFRRVAAQNVVYVEMFFDPQAHTSRGIDFGTVISGLRRAQQTAEEQFGIRSQLIMCFLRDMTAESAAETLDQASEYREWIVGVGLDSDERDNPPIKFRDVFTDARSQGYRLTMHCDVDQDDSVAHIWQCLDDIGVERIDHGVNCLEDDALVKEILSRGIGLTACPISNSYVTNGTKSAEIKTMLDKGMLVTINSDDPAYFPGYMAENLATVQQGAGLSNDEIVRLVRNAFTISWLTDDEQATYIAAVDELVSRSA